MGWGSKHNHQFWVIAGWEMLISNGPVKVENRDGDSSAFWTLGGGTLATLNALEGKVGWCLGICRRLLGPKWFDSKFIPSVPSCGIESDLQGSPCFPKVRTLLFCFAFIFCFYIPATVSPPSPPSLPFPLHYPHPLLVHFSSENGRSWKSTSPSI